MDETLTIGETVGEVVKQNTLAFSGILAVFFLLSLFFGGMFAYKKRKQSRIRLQGREVRQQPHCVDYQACSWTHKEPIFVADSDAKPVVTVTQA
jgi:hypothetical protein